MADNVNEEHFLFVVHDVHAREVINAALQSSADVEPIVDIEMVSARVGKISIMEGDSLMLLPCSLHEMSTIIEMFKSHNHINLIKSGDIGQGFIVHQQVHASEDPPITQEEALNATLAELIDLEHTGGLPQEMECGLTPPMTAGRSTFRMQMNPKPEVVTEVEEQLLALMHGEAPEGWIIEDTAEVYLDGKGWVALADAPAEFRTAEQQPNKQQENKDKS